MDVCSLCRKQIAETAPERWTTDDGDAVFIARTAAPSAFVATSLGEIDVCDACYAQPMPSWLTADDIREIHYQFGLEHAQRGEPRDALACLERALVYGPTAPILAALGNAQAALGAPDDAAASYRRALEIDPDHWVRDNLNRLTRRCS